MRRPLILLIALVLGLTGCAEADRGIGQPSGAATASTPTAAVWPLRGTKAPDADSIKRRPIVVKVAADPAARPQSGLADADLVLEIPVEGGITRFAAVFHSTDPGKVGPVRSARQSDLNYLASLRAIVAHVGASQQVTKLVRDAAKGGAFVDVDEFEHADAFERTSDRPAPYNAYTTGAKLRKVGGDDKVAVPTLVFGEAAATTLDGATLTVPTAEPITYAYDSGKGAYQRTYNGGAPTTDEGTEVLPENVVVILTDVTEIPGTADAAGASSVDYRSTGSGKVVILRDGRRYEGTWAREGNAMYAFKDASGAVIPLKPGLTWLHILPSGKM